MGDALMRFLLPHLPLAPLFDSAGLTAEANRARVAGWAPDPRTRRNGQHPSEIELLASRCGYTRRQVHRWDLEGIPFYTADKVACRLGLHPSNVWPEWWDMCAEVSAIEADAETNRWLKDWLRTNAAREQRARVREADAAENRQARIDRWFEVCADMEAVA